MGAVAWGLMLFLGLTELLFMTVI